MPTVVMSDSQSDTSGMSVASRIRMLQSNFGKEPEAVSKNRVSPRSSPKTSPHSSSKQNHSAQGCKEQSPPSWRKANAVIKTNEKVVEKPAKLDIKSPNANSKSISNEQLEKSPLPSPRPSPRPSPHMSHKTGLVHSSPVISRESSIEDHEITRASSKENIRKTSSPDLKFPKPPLPSKAGLSKTKDFNDNLVPKPFVKQTKKELPAKPLAPKKSWEKTDDHENKDTSSQSWKRISGPPSKPVPPVPALPDNECNEVSPQLFVPRIIKSSTLDENNRELQITPQEDNFYEDPNNSLHQNDFDSDDNYEEADAGCDPKDHVDARESSKKKGKVLARLSTSRRPPPLPLVPSHDGRPRAGSKPPPLPSSKRPVQTAEEQALYSYATEVRFEISPRPAVRASRDCSYETPDANAVRGLMLGLNNANCDYETPDASSVNDFMANVGTDAMDGNNDYEMPDQESVKRFTESLERKNVQQAQEESDQDSDAYCDPETVPSLMPGLCPPIPNHAPQKSLPLPPTDGSDSSSSDEDSRHDYEDPTETYPRHVSLRRGSMPVYNPDAYLELQDEDLGSMYQDPAEAFSSRPDHTKQENSQDSDEYDDLSDEPLYQVYTADVLSHMKRISQKEYKEEEDVFSEYSTSSIESGQRVLWCQLDSVRGSGILDKLEPQEKKRQEAMFEVITSEASYLKSLNILVNNFMSKFVIKPGTPPEEKLLDKQQFHFLFGGLNKIKSTSEKILHSLRGRQEENFVISSISDIVHDYATKHFECYIKYCSNQVYQERTLTSLINENPAFSDVLGKLESSSKSQGLSMQSFLMLPMQRITRLPLLLDAICRHCEPGSDEFNSTNNALNAVHKVVKECNEGARKMERIEEMYFVQQMLYFKIKPIPIVSSSRWLLRRGELACLETEKKLKSPFRTLIRGGKYYRIYLFLFNDLLLVTKMKSEDSFKVVDYCSRSMLKIDDVLIPTGDTIKPSVVGIPTSKHMFTIVLLENHREKTTRYVCMAETETEKIRWMEAVQPKHKEANEGEKVYEEWDCPQVRAIHAYQSEQPDELSMLEGDVIKVLRKLTDGWYEGVRLRDEEQGWFPANHTEEIHSEHTRAKNLMQRYRLLNNATLALSRGIKKD